MIRKASTLEQILGAFTPHPLEGNIFDEFYVDTYEARGNNPIEKIRLNMEYALNPYCKTLFLGHSGSGKSTELYLLRETVKDKYGVICFPILEEVDSFDMYYTDFVFAIMSQLLKYIDENSISVSDANINTLYEYWNKEQIFETIQYGNAEAQATVGAKFSFLRKLSLEGKGIFKTGAQTKITTREKIEKRIGYLIELLNHVIDDVNHELLIKEGKELLFIIEDLDKIDYTSASKLFVEHRQAVTAIKAKFVLTCPIYLVYDKYFHILRDDFDYCQLLNMIKVETMNKQPYETGISTINYIVEKRCNTTLFEKDEQNNVDVLRFLITKSGGVLRDLFQMIREAAMESILKHKSIITMDEAKIAYRNLKSEYSRLITNEKYYAVMKDIYYNPIPAITDGTMEELLLRGLIIEYNGERWCGLHPAVTDFLVEKGILNGRQ